MKTNEDNRAIIVITVFALVIVALWYFDPYANPSAFKSLSGVVSEQIRQIAGSSQIH